MVKKIKQLLFLVASLLIITACNHSQEVSESLSGHNAVLKGQISAEAPNGTIPMDSILVMVHGTEKTTVTDQNGNFTFSGLKPGHYVLAVSSRLYHPRNHDVDVAGDTTSVIIHLLPN